MRNENIILKNIFFENKERENFFGDRMGKEWFFL